MEKEHSELHTAIGNRARFEAAIHVCFSLRLFQGSVHLIEIAFSPQHWTPFKLRDNLLRWGIVVFGENRKIGTFGVDCFFHLCADSFSQYQCLCQILSEIYSDSWSNEIINTRKNRCRMKRRNCSNDTFFIRAAQEKINSNKHCTVGTFFVLLQKLQGIPQLKKLFSLVCCDKIML